MYVCEMVWEPSKAREVSAQVERATNQPCPCKRGLPCPFVRSVEPRSEEVQEPQPVAG
jgi:hypothetical protein